MRFLSWNIDGANAVIRKCNFVDFLWMWKADIFAFQETKLKSPDVRIKFPGYYEYWSFFDNCPTSSQQSGVVCFSKRKAKKVITSFDDNDFDAEGRLIILEFEHFYFVNVYVPNSQDEVSGRNKAKSVGRREYRAKFDKLLLDKVIELDKKKPVIMCGDFNAALSSIDMDDSSSWQEDKGGFLKEANDRLNVLTKSGYTDTYRYLYPIQKRAYTHWSIKDKNRDTSPGRRLDYFFVSDDLASKIHKATICKEMKGSDHAPISLDINLSKPTHRNESIINLTYSDLLDREGRKIYYHDLKGIDLTLAWDTIDWNKAKAHLKSMQCAIACSAKAYEIEKMERLQYKLVSSLDAKILAVRTVTARDGQAGIDHIKWTTSDERMHAAISLTSKNYSAKPAIMVKKINNGKQRNIHIDTYYDRAMQALYGFSLAPIAETWSDRKSFANRRNRSTLDADYYIREIYSGKDAPRWIYKTDVMKCYESISHDWIRERIPMARKVLDEFLRAGYFYAHRYYDMYKGVGIGCRMSVYLSNMCLDGLQEYIYARLNPRKSEEEIDLDNGHMVRFADDIMVSARDFDTASEIGRIISDFMRRRGLILSAKKTEIIYVPNGFEFLKRSYKLYDNYLISSPSERSVINFKNKISNYIMGFKGSQERLIDDLNKRMIGFVTYHKMTDAYDTFHELDYFVRATLFNFCEKRYPSWNMNRIKKEFWLVDDKKRPNYVLKNASHKSLIFMEDTIPTTYTPLPLEMNPFIDYKQIEKITKDRDVQNVIGKYKKLWEKQSGLCACCQEMIYPSDEKALIEVDCTEINFFERMAYIHSRCINTFEYSDETKEEEKDPSGSLIVELSKEYKCDDIPNNPLYQYFKESEDNTITLSIKKIGEIYGIELNDMANIREFWLDDSNNSICRCWLDNDYVVKKISTEGRRCVTFHKYHFTGDTGKVYIPDLLLHGEVPMRMKLRLEAMMQHEFERNGLLWE